MNIVHKFEYYPDSKQEKLPNFSKIFPYIASRAELDHYVGKRVPWDWHLAYELFLHWKWLTNRLDCFNKKQTLLSKPIPKTEIDRLVRNAINLKRPLSIASDKLLIANGKDQDLVDYFAFAHQEVIVFGDFEQIVAVADDLCGHVEEEGVYHYCKAMGLI